MTSAGGRGSESLILIDPAPPEEESRAPQAHVGPSLNRDLEEAGQRQSQTFGDKGHMAGASPPCSPTHLTSHRNLGGRWA